MDTLTHCPNCNTKLGGIMKSYSMYNTRTTELINTVLERNDKAHCTKCSAELIQKVKSFAESNRENYTKSLNEILNDIPVVSIHNPPKWEFEVIGIVTGQSTTGTGIVSEFLSSWTDLVGAQSKTYNNKLRDGENLCLYQIRTKAINLGGNAVVGTDVDYSEVGGVKGMLMVCMTGTAIKITNLESIKPGLSDLIIKARKLQNNLLIFEEIKNSFPFRN